MNKESLNKSCVELVSPGKINLILKILGKRDDDFHELLTRMVMISCSDRVFIEKAPLLQKEKENEISLILKGREILGDPQDNLVVRAAKMVFEKIGVITGWSLKITLEKNIPVGAGLGGGSSNAAATLIGTNQVMGGVLEREDLTELASQLGSDVPFFLGPPNAFCWGRGEKILSLPPESERIIVLWNSGFNLSTGLVYKSLSAGKSERLTEEDAVSKIDSLLRENALLNDLESVAVGLYPVIASVKKALYLLGAEGAMMSGSGPTVFGLFSHESIAEKASDSLVKNYGGWSGVFRTLEESPLS